ncbi:MAG: polysaccharide biosynthesis tyrosine autokinase [Lachnospiraceae bacterium]|nr:polysaccharide biosynthesis tyrosine autokinase [Lachnospiraceae bacterium]
MKEITIRKPEMSFFNNEAFKSIRTNLIFCGLDKKVIAFTSCFAGDGKTSTVFRLALSLAESGRMVLVMDADLRNSGMLGAASISADKITVGLSHVLSGQNPAQDAVYSTNVENLRMVFSGPFAPNPSELLASRIFRDMIADLRGLFDFILIDTPPIGMVIDAAVICDVCDGSVLVLSSGATRVKMAKEAKAQLEKTGKPILGAILNNVKVSGSGHRKYGKYSRQYGAEFTAQEKNGRGRK